MTRSYGFIARASGLAALLVLCQGLAPAQSAPLAPEDFATLSDRVFVGRVVGQQSFLSDDGRLIQTRFTFEIGAMLKGDLLPVAEVIEYGGRIGEKWLHVTHGARYRQGAEYLVFARRDSQGRLRTLGGWQGRLPVLRDAAGGALVRVHRQHPVGAYFFSDRETDLLPLDTANRILADRLRRSP